MRPPEVLTNWAQGCRRLSAVADGRKMSRGMIQIAILHLLAFQRPLARHGGLANVIWVSKIQYGITQYSQPFFTSEPAGRWIFSCLCTTPSMTHCQN